MKLNTTFPRPFLAALFAFVLPVLARAADAPLRVVALHPVLAEFAAEIAGPAARVENFVPGGADPHTFEPTPRQVASARRADLVFANGLHLERYLERVADPENRGDRLVRVGERLPNPLAASHHHHDHQHAPGEPCGDGINDPHWWHGLDNALAAADIIRAELTRVRPAHAADFAARAETLRARLTALQTWAAAAVAPLPPERRHLVTTHDAFGHLAREHGFTVHPLGGLSTENEVSARRLAELSALVRELRLPAIFMESAGTDRVLRNLAKDLDVIIPAPLLADGPDAPGTGRDTYETMYRHNLTTIVEALR